METTLYIAVASHVSEMSGYELQVIEPRKTSDTLRSVESYAQLYDL